MHVKNHIAWLTYMVAAGISISLADTTNPHISTVEQVVFHRNKTLQDIFGNNYCSTPVATPPWLNRCEETGTFHQNQTLRCVNITECIKKTVDLVFLIDGSGSMREDEFTRNKYVINDIMDSLKNTSIKFAAVQFSSTYRKVFDFNDYEAGRALDKLKAEQHMKTLTNTHKALRFVLEDIMENPASGASRDATKVLVLITDGDPSDTDRHGIINTYDEKSIIRFVIGVKEVTLDRFTNISSAPTEKYAFKIENYDGLKGILENFQKRIFKIEGFNLGRAGDLTGEMSQGGFSLAFNKLSGCEETLNPHLNQTLLCLIMPECIKKTVDLVFLIDGSASMIKDEFTRNKYVINDIMDSLKNTSIKFAAVQFSTTYRKVFDFNDYEAGRALDKLKAEQHMKTLTNTHKALRFVLEDIMENPASGASRDATKVLVLITDGGPSDTDRHGIIKTYDEKSIIRFVIGVRDANPYVFGSIASLPAQKYIFPIESYAGLIGILEDLTKRIFETQGCGERDS